MVLLSRSSSLVVFFILCQIFSKCAADSLYYESAQVRTRSLNESEPKQKPSSNTVSRLWNKVWNSVYEFFANYCPSTGTQSKSADSQYCCKCESSNIQPKSKKWPKWVKIVGSCFAGPPCFCYLIGETVVKAGGICVVGGATFIGYAVGDAVKYCAKKCCMLNSKSSSEKNQTDSSESQTT